MVEWVRLQPLSIKIMGGMLILLISISTTALGLMIENRVSGHKVEFKAHTNIDDRLTAKMVSEICKVQDCKTTLVR